MNISNIQNKNYNYGKYMEIYGNAKIINKQKYFKYIKIWKNYKQIYHLSILGLLFIFIFPSLRIFYLNKYSLRESFGSPFFRISLLIR